MIIDTDTGSDDAVALVMAMRDPNVKIEAVTVVAGNGPLEMALQNALYTREICDCSAPLYAGCAAPMFRALETAQDVHGVDGMGDIGLPLQGRQPESGHAVDVLIELILRYPGKITLVTLGPLTNIAVALMKNPSIAQKVENCVMMGGASDARGNVSQVAEFNIWADPEAAKIVFESGMPITMVGWDISRKYAVFDKAEAAALRAVGTPLAEFCMDIQGKVDEFALEVTQLRGFDLPDPISMAVAQDSATATMTQKLYVEIEPGDGLCRGQTVVDYLGVAGKEPNVEVVLEASRERFLEILYTAVGGEYTRD